MCVGSLMRTINPSASCSRLIAPHTQRPRVRKSFTNPIAPAFASSLAITPSPETRPVTSRTNAVANELLELPHRLSAPRLVSRRGKRFDHSGVTDLPYVRMTAYCSDISRLTLTHDGKGSQDARSAHRRGRGFRKRRRFRGRVDREGLRLLPSSRRPEGTVG